MIKRKDGSIFELKSVVKKKPSLDVEGVNLKIEKEEIIDILRGVRNR